MALVEGLREEFADHDVFLHLLLGMVSASRQSEQLLPPVPRDPPADPAPVLEGELERRVMLLLGLISARRTLMGTLEPVRASQGLAGSTRTSAAPGGLPRDLDLLR